MNEGVILKAVIAVLSGVCVFFLREFYLETRETTKAVNKLSGQINLLSEQFKPLFKLQRDWDFLFKKLRENPSAIKDLEKFHQEQGE